MPLIIIGVILGLFGLTTTLFGRRRKQRPAWVRRVDIALGVLALVLIVVGLIITAN